MTDSAELYSDTLSYMGSRGVVLPTQYYGTMFGTSRAAAFSIAGITAMDQLQGALDSLTASIESGGTFKEWQRAVSNGDIVLDLPKHRLDNIFRTNLQGAYKQGSYARMAERYERAPYLMYDAINDHRVRPNHLALDGFIARWDHPVWSTHKPPLGYRCRCTLIQLTERQARRRGYTAEPARPDTDTDEGWDYDKAAGVVEGLQRALNKRAGRCDAIPFAPTARPMWCAPGKASHLMEAISKELALTAAADFSAAFLTLVGKARYNKARDELLHRGAVGTGLTEAEQVALYLWTRDTSASRLYERLNRSIREARIEDVAEYWPMIAMIESALNKLPPEPGVVFRRISSKGMGGIDAAQDLHAQGSRISMPGFTATSRKLDEALKGDIEIVIRGHSGRNISEFSSKPDQAETLFSHGVQFDVLQSERDNDRLIVVLQEVDE